QAAAAIRGSWEASQRVRRHRPRKRAIQYSVALPLNTIARPSRTGCPAFAGHDARWGRSDRLLGPATQVVDQALLAQRTARHAGVAAVQDQPVMGMQLEFIGYHLLEIRLDLARVLAGREAGAVADLEDVGVDRDGRLAERDVEHHVGGLAPDARQRL